MRKTRRHITRWANLSPLLLRNGFSVVETIDYSRPQPNSINGYLLLNGHFHHRAETYTATETWLAATGTTHTSPAGTPLDTGDMTLKHRRTLSHEAAPMPRYPRRHDTATRTHQHRTYHGPTGRFVVMSHCDCVLTTATYELHDTGLVSSSWECNSTCVNSGSLLSVAVIWNSDTPDKLPRLPNTCLR